MGWRTDFHGDALATAPFIACSIRSRAAFDFFRDRLFRAHVFAHYRGRTGSKMVGDSETCADCAGHCVAAAMVLLAFLSVWLGAQSHCAMAAAAGGHRAGQRKRARAFGGGVAVVA